MVRQKHRITVSVEGLPFKPGWKTQVNDVEIEMRESAFDRTKKLMATVEVDDDVEEISIKANELIDKALTNLSFAYGFSVRRSNEMYITVLEPEPNIRKYGWGYHKAMLTSNAISAVDYLKILEEHLSKVRNLAPDKQLVFNKAAALYREALGLNNPPVAQILYFSAGAVIAREMYPQRLLSGRRNDLTTSVLRDAYRTVANTEETKFLQLFEQLHGNDYGRSGVDHGRIDVTDPLSIGNARVLLPLLRNWTRLLIQKYVDDNQIPTVTAPKNSL